ncbi:MAG: type II toxin-antitoxin system VapC family toxin [Xanthobacteraceae bacterium]
MSVLLDTNACIAVMNAKPQARERFRQVRRRREVASVSTITLFELWFGIIKSSRTSENTGQLEAFLPTIQTVDFDDEDARIAADLRLSLTRAGTPIGSYDLLIASQALRHGLIVVTANVREFSRVPDLRLENWET